MIDNPKILPFKDDYVFKALLTRYDSGLIRNSMISAFTGLKIVSSVVAENEPAAEAALLEKEVRFDVHCVTDDGTRIEIEMQAHSMEGDNASNGHINLRARSLYYMAKLFAVQDAKEYIEMSKAFQIMICDYTVFADDRFIHKFYYRDEDTLLSDYCGIIFVELPKIKKSLDKPFDEMTDDERWAVFVEYANDSRFEGKVLEFEVREEFKKAMESLRGVSQSERDYYHYISRLKYEKDKATELYMARREGKTDALIETAKRLIKLGVSPELIAEGVALPISKIAELRG